MNPLVGIIMGSKSDWEALSPAASVLEALGVPFEARVLSAHRTPHHTAEYVETAEERGLEVIIAAAGAAAHLPGVAAAYTTLPVLGVPMDATSLRGMDALLAMVQMPGGIPVATFAIGSAGAKNAAIFAASILAGKHTQYREALKKLREEQKQKVLAIGDPRG